MQNTHKSVRYAELHDLLLSIVSTLNRPQRDDLMIEASRIQLDRALFPLLVLIGRFGPIGVVELADRVGRDYTTVSRQVTKLEELGLTKHQKNAKDKRVNESAITPEGKAITDKIDEAREKIYEKIFLEWDKKEEQELERLLKKLVDDFTSLNP